MGRLGGARRLCLIAGRAQHNNSTYVAGWSRRGTRQDADATCRGERPSMLIHRNIQNRYENRARWWRASGVRTDSVWLSASDFIVTQRHTHPHQATQARHLFHRLWEGFYVYQMITSARLEEEGETLITKDTKISDAPASRSTASGPEHPHEEIWQ